MKNLILFIQLFISQIFFSSLIILGIDYGGKEDSNAYIVMVGIFAFLSLFISVFGIIKNKLDRQSVLFFILPLLIILLYFIDERSQEGFHSFLLFLSFSLPSIYVAIYMAKSKSIAGFAKFFEILMLLISTAIIIKVYMPFLEGGYFESTKSADYQTISYLSSLAFLINLLFLFFAKYFVLLRWRKYKSYKFILLVLLFMQVFGVFFSGGRGGAVVVVVASLVLGSYKIRNYKIRFDKLILSLTFTILLMVIVGSYLYDNNIFFKNSFDRTFSYLSSEGIDMSQTSNRDIVYQMAVDLIKEKPVFGYGLFGYYAHMWYPHNLFFEFLLVGGIFLFMFGLSFLGFTCWKLIKMIQYDKKNLILLPLFIFIFVQLMFSGTFLTNPLFWYTIVYISCFKNIRNKKLTIED